MKQEIVLSGMVLFLAVFHAQYWAIALALALTIFLTLKLRWRFEAAAMALVFALTQLSSSLWPGFVLLTMLVTALILMKHRVSLREVPTYIVSFIILLVIGYEASEKIMVVLLLGVLLHEFLYREFLFNSLFGKMRFIPAALLVASFSAVLLPWSYSTLVFLAAEVVACWIYVRKGVWASGAFMGGVALVLNTNIILLLL